MAYGDAGMPPFVKPGAYIIYLVEVLSCGGECSEPEGPPELLQAGFAPRESVCFDAAPSFNESALSAAASELLGSTD